MLSGAGKLRRCGLYRPQTCFAAHANNAVFVPLKSTCGASILYSNCLFRLLLFLILHQFNVIIRHVLVVLLNIL